MSEIKEEVIKVLNVIEASVKINLPSEESDAKVEEIQKIRTYIENQTNTIQKEN